MKLLILGGTGFLGPHTVRRAKALGHTVTLFNRGKTRPDLFDDETLLGDREGDLASLEQAVAAGRKWDAVIDNSGYVPSHVEATARILAPAAGMYVFISSVSAYGTFPEKGMDETAPLEQVPAEQVQRITRIREVGPFFGGLKALCEQAAQGQMPGRVCSIRPHLIVGPGDPTDRFTYWPVRIADGGEVLAPCVDAARPGAEPLQWIDARDLAAFIVACCSTGTTGTFNAAGPGEPMTVGRFLSTCQEVAASGATLTWVPMDFLLKHGVGPGQPLPFYVPDTGPYAGMMSLSHARARAAGLTFTPPAQTIADTLDWWRTLPAERTAKLRAGMTPQKEAAVLAAWKAEGSRES